MIPFDNFKLIDKWRRRIKSDGAVYTHKSSEYGTMECSSKKDMLASIFYKEYVREFGWDFCERAAVSCPIITDAFLKYCHFFEWNERDDFEIYLCDKNANERFEDLKKYIPIFDGNELDYFIKENLGSEYLKFDTILLYGWLTQQYEFDEEAIAALERGIIGNFRKQSNANDFFSEIRKITNAALGKNIGEIKVEQAHEENIQLDEIGQKAIELVKSGANLFITGKAGTGKTTLLRQILHKTDKKVAVVAPTGVAAKNAVGITIHSFLRLPVTPYFPGITNPELYQLKKTDEQVVKEVDTIIIDEVSMVRCDLLDAMDDVLRHYRKSSRVFGGVQVIMFGDLFQLMPVAPDEEWNKLKEHYASPYFFSSKVYPLLSCQILELKKVYRQNESDFITILNNIREGRASYQELKILNTRYEEKAELKAKDAIMLTTHNRRANGYNWGRLQKLPGDIHEYKASVSGWFPSDEYPTSYTLQLKMGAKVMFVKNDTIEHAFYNGMMGVVTKLGHGYVEVEAEGNMLFVTPQYWEHQKYVINKETKKLEVEVTGSFVRLPLRLAWAVTIHKSQGLTFEKVLIDAERAFTFGQVYVALSRCRTLKGIYLASRLTEKCIKADDIVKRFMSENTAAIAERNNEDVSSRKHVSFQSPEEKTLFFIKNGLTVDEIVEKCAESKAIILNHIAKLVAQRKVKAETFVPADKFKKIERLFQRYGLTADRKRIKGYATEVSFAEIEIVRSHMSLSSNTEVEVRNDKETKQSIREKIVLNIGAKTLAKIYYGKKQSYKKAIYSKEDAKLFFIDYQIIKLENVEDICTYTLCRYRKVHFVSTESTLSVERAIDMITVEGCEISPGNKRWVATINFKL